jgi:hypothetical protein
MFFSLSSDPNRSGGKDKKSVLLYITAATVSLVNLCTPTTPTRADPTTMATEV